MMQFFVTDAIISKGPKDKPALRFSESGKTVQFRIGKRVYDKREEENQRWVNINVRVLDEALCERIRKMKLDAGSFIHIRGRYDEDVWTADDKTMRAPVIIVEHIEYAYSGNSKGKQNGNKDTAPGTQTPPAEPSADSDPEAPGNFTGYQSFGSGSEDSQNPFFPAG